MVQICHLDQPSTKSDFVLFHVEEVCPTIQGCDKTLNHEDVFMVVSNVRAGTVQKKTFDFSQNLIKTP